VKGEKGLTQGICGKIFILYSEKLKSASHCSLTHMYEYIYSALLYIKQLLTLSFLSLPASHLCHQGLGWPCIIVRSFIY